MSNDNFNKNKSQAPQNVFVNPYTFIELSKNKPTREAVKKGEYTGKISCKLEVKSPVFIPNTTFDCNVNGHKHNVFYSYTDLSNEKSLTDEIRKPQNPVIPGSEIRGMIRNVYEQLTNSCFSEVDEFNLPYKRTNEPKELCIMCWDENVWKLYYNLDEKKGDYYKGYEKKQGYYYRVPKYSLRDTANKQITYKKPDKNNPHFFELNKKTLERFEMVIGANENVKGGYSGKFYEVYREWYLRKERPLIVYVDKASIDADKKEADFKNRVIYLSPACMGKEFFENKIPDILHKNAEHDKCTSIGNACPACRLFGMIGEKGAVKGRLRFSDSYGANKVEYLEDKTLPILATPRISATEFYLRAPEIWKNKNGGFDGTWNYDYYTTYTEETPPLFNRNNYTPEPAGRKVYWNRTFEITNEEKGKMNNTITPIENGIFSFDVYFDKLTKDELENLLFCLELNDNNSEKPSVHKIGHGKPLGMGQVKLTVENVECIEYKLVGSSVIRESKKYCSNSEDRAKILEKKEGESILRYSTDIANDKHLISYPIGEDKNGKRDTRFWFANNSGSVRAPKIRVVLPNIMDENQKIAVNQPISGKPSNKCNKMK